MKHTELGRVDDAAPLADFDRLLASPAGHWISGQAIRVTGGIN